MIPIAITQRVVEHGAYQERRDCLDQRWAEFLSECDLLPLAVPNSSKLKFDFLDEAPVQGILLTGGNSLVDYGGNAQERDGLECHLMEKAIKENIPVLGVCRGMQVIQNFFNVPLEPVAGHVSDVQKVQIEGRGLSQVNSYHNIGTYSSCPQLTPWAWASDKLIKAVKHESHPILGIMWHPERMTPFLKEDVSLFRYFFNRSSTDD